MESNSLILCIAGVATLGVIARPFRSPEYVWAVSGAALIVVLGLMPWRDALRAAGKGTDVYLFLGGMMLLSEVARQEGLFDWLAALAVRCSKGSAKRLFLIIYCVGIVVTVFLSNDATAVVLTPAVYAAAKAARVEPLPYLFICAFVANAASFVLPISNPANLVVFGADMPPLVTWLRHFILPSIVSIVVTYIALRWTQRSVLQQDISEECSANCLSLGGKWIAAGIGFTGMVLLAASALDQPLGLPTFLSGLATTVIVLCIGRKSPFPVLRDISWGVLPLVAGLFILVEAVEATGVLRPIVSMLHQSAATSPGAVSFQAGAIVALASNLLNNLPAGLLAATIGQSADVPIQVTSGLLIGVDLGPNLSVTGSLATVLWLAALRREGEAVTAVQFLRAGIVIMPAALLLTLAVNALTSP